MLDIKYIREHKEEVQANCANRLAVVDIASLLQLDDQPRELIGRIDALRGERNQKSKAKPTEVEIAKMKRVGEEIAELEKALSVAESELNAMLLAVPNLTHPEVLVSTDESENHVLETVGIIPKFDFEPLDHVALAVKHDLIEFERATKVSGAKFYYLKNDLARLELALVNYVVDLVIKHGYSLMTTPDLAKTEIIERLGFNPRGESTQVYNIEGTDLSLIGTAEITLGGLYADEVLDISELPKKYVGISHCFRTEAGSYSKFSKGIFRVHQFTKVEMFVYATPEQSEAIHQEILEIEKEIFSGLGLTYQVVDHCTADLGNPSYRTFDLEAWMPASPAVMKVEEGQAVINQLGRWGEITSTSNCTDYQARGLNIKYKTADGQKDYVYTLNGTAVATTRALIAILETNQQSDGSIVIPEVLRPYMGGQEII
jgi:seryl-tRNA synthetase